MAIADRDDALDPGFMDALGQGQHRDGIGEIPVTQARFHERLLCST
jgi:hypothetical protein